MRYSFFNHPFPALPKQTTINRRVDQHHAALVGFLSPFERPKRQNGSVDITALDHLNESRWPSYLAFTWITLRAALHNPCKRA